MSAALVLVSVLLLLISLPATIAPDPEPSDASETGSETATNAATTSLPLSSSTNDYLTTTLRWGSPVQGPFTVFVDTTSSLSFVVSSEAHGVTTAQTSFRAAESTSFTAEAARTFQYLYQNQTIGEHGQMCTETLMISNYDLTSQPMGLSSENPALFINEAVSGILALDMESTIAANLQSAGDCDSSTISILIDTDEIVFGNYEYSSINTTTVPIDHTHGNANLQSDWVFKLESVAIEDFIIFPAGTNVFASIDAASPYLTIFAPSYNDFLTIWKNLDGSSSTTTTTTTNCNTTTRECTDTSSVRSSLTLTNSAADNRTYYISKSDLVVDGYLSVLHGGSAYTNGENYVFFLGKPFLSSRIVQLKADTSTIEISSITVSSSSGAEYLLIIIILACVIGFAIIFFAIYFWRNKIPAPGGRGGGGDGNRLGGGGGGGGGGIGRFDSGYGSASQGQALGGRIPQRDLYDDDQVQLLSRANVPDDNYNSGYVRQAPRSAAINVNVHTQQSDEIRERRLRFLDNQDREEQKQQTLGGLDG